MRWRRSRRSWSDFEVRRRTRLPFMMDHMGLLDSAREAWSAGDRTGELPTSQRSSAGKSWSGKGLFVFIGGKVSVEGVLYTRARKDLSWL